MISADTRCQQRERLVWLVIESFYSGGLEKVEKVFMGSDEAVVRLLAVSAALLSDSQAEENHLSQDNLSYFNERFLEICPPEIRRTNRTKSCDPSEVLEVLNEIRWHADMPDKKDTNAKYYALYQICRDALPQPSGQI